MKRNSKASVIHAAIVPVEPKTSGPSWLPPVPPLPKRRPKVSAATKALIYRAVYGMVRDAYLGRKVTEALVDQLRREQAAQLAESGSGDKETP